MANTTSKKISVKASASKPPAGNKNLGLDTDIHLYAIEYNYETE